ncbi:vacuolar h+transporting two sector atpase f subunit [mine drainage metagenome]|uniref:Vacuolar h+transporting two sector atpase f subunit n=1 Tax=mine drainage metagenome TaxID=410659 RepID=T1B837_9ZZZZ
MPDQVDEPRRTVVLGERELAIGFRLIGLSDVVEVTPSTAQGEFQKVVGDPATSLVIASQSVRSALSETQRFHAENSLRPLVVFVPAPTGEYEVESISALAKRILGVSLSVPH